MQQIAKRASTAIKLLLETVFSIRFVQNGYKKGIGATSSDPRVEAGSNTSTVTLRVVGGDENGSLKSETVKYGRESQGIPTKERLRWQRPAAYIYKTDPSSRQRARPTRTRS
jgi:hypothetical protein